jgi:effector-binding domain-containing protein
MKILKALLIIIVLCVVAAIIAGITAPSHVHVERSITIDAPFEAIYQPINDLKQWESWSPWHKMDTTMQVTYGSISEGLGASYRWDSKNGNVGKGELTITHSSNDSICTAMNFMENGIGTGKFSFSPAEKGIHVTWSMESDMGANPFKKLFGYLMDKMVGPVFEKGLNDLKTIAEKSPIARLPKFEIKEVALAEKTFIMKKDSVAWDSLSSYFKNNLPPLLNATIKAKLQSTGAPYGLYFKWDEKNRSTVMAIAIPIANQHNTKIEGYSRIVIPAGKNLHIEYIGGYAGSANAHIAMDNYMKEHNLLQGIPVMEEYVVGPAQESDSTKWKTNIYYPVK